MSQNHINMILPLSNLYNALLRYQSSYPYEESIALTLLIDTIFIDHTGETHFLMYNIYIYNLILSF